MAKFWRPAATDIDKGAVRDGDSSVLINANRHKHLALSQQRQLLPIFKLRTHILYAVDRYRTVVLVGGKCLALFFCLTSKK
jgi:ATP-dependent RNA helicase DDX35